MSGINFPNIAQQAQEKMKEDATKVECAIKDAADQATQVCKDGFNKVCKQAEEGYAKAAEQTTKATSDLQKKFQL